MTSIATHIPASSSKQLPTALFGWHAFVRRHGFIIPSFLIAMSVCFWFVTWGHGRLFDSERFTSFYDAQARALLHGRFDVPPAAIDMEAFVRNGKSYGYFGIAPALVRLPLVALFPGMDGRWSRSFMLVACGINLACAYRLVLKLRQVGPEYGDAPAQKIILSLFVLCAGIGSTNIFIASRSYTYHEAIMWGGAFALLFTDCLLSYLATPTLKLLAAAGAFAFLSFHCRPTAGSGALMALCVLIATLTFRAGRGSIIGLTPIARPMAHIVLACFAVLATVGVYFAVNYRKFRTFDGVPVQFYSQYVAHPERMAGTGGRQFHIENVPTVLASYFGVGGLRFTSRFPWAHMIQRPIVLGSPNIDVIEPYSSVPVSMPAMAFLALAGIWPMIRGRSDVLRRFRLLALALLAGGSIVLFTVGMTERYLHDFYPFLIVAGAVGVWRLDPSVEEGVSSRPRLRRNAGLLTVLAMVSIYLNCTFAMEFKRHRLGIPEDAATGNLSRASHR